MKKSILSRAFKNPKCKEQKKFKVYEYLDRFEFALFLTRRSNGQILSVLLSFLVIVLLVWGCTPFRHISEHALTDDDMVLLDVPFVPQAQDNDCGPAALASVLKFYGMNVPLDELTAEVYIPALNRTLMPDMENYARNKGFETSAGSGSISLLTKKIDSGHPVIILMDAGTTVIKSPHYIVVWGYNSKGFLAHAGYRDNVFISFEDLDPRWQKMNRLYLVLKDNSAGQ